MHQFLKKLLDWGFMRNTWAWFHIMAGCIGAKLALIFFQRWESLFIIFLLAVAWELIEFIYEGGEEGVIDIYGSLDRWWFDSLGDVVGATLMAYVVVV